MSEDIENLLSELYQILGALNAPVNILDQVSEAISGQNLPYKTLLPFDNAPKGYALVPVDLARDVAEFAANTGRWELQNSAKELLSILGEKNA